MAKKLVKKKAAPVKKNAPMKKAPKPAAKKVADKKAPAKKVAEKGDKKVADKKGVKKAEVKKAPRKPRGPKIVRLKAFWGVFNQSLRRVALFEFNERKLADKKAEELTKSGKSPHFVQPVKETIET